MSVFTVGGEHIRLLMDSIPECGIIGLDPIGRVTSWSAGARLLTGYPEAEALGQPVSMLYGAEEVARGGPAAELGIAAEAGAFEGEGWRIRKDGSRFLARVVIAAVRDAQGGLVGFAQATRDLSAHALVEQERRELLERERQARLQAEALTEELRNQAEQLEDQSIELEAQLEELQGQAMLLEENQLGLEMAGAELQRANAELGAAEAHYRRLVDTSPYGIFVLATSGAFTEVNAAGERILDRPSSEVIGRGFAEMIAPEDLETATDAFARVITGADRKVEVEVSVLHPSGERRLINVVITAIEADGAIAGVHGVSRDITEERRTRSALQSSEASYRSLFDSLTDLVYLLDQNGRFIGVNDAVIQRYGYTRSEIVGSTPALLTAPGMVDPERTVDRIRAAADGQPQRFELWARTKQGETFPKEVILTRGDYFGAPVVIAVGRDISERKEAEATLRRSEQRFRQLAEHIDAVFWLYDLAEGRTVYASPSFERIWGRPREALQADSRAWTDALHPEDRERVLANSEATREREYEIEYRIVRPDGEVRWIRDRGFPVADEGGRIYRTAGTAEDITERKQAEEARDAAEAHYRRLVENAPYCIFALDTAGRFTELSPATEAIIGYPPSRLLGRPLADLIVPEDLPVAAGSLRSKLAGEVETSDVEFRVRHSSGELRHIHVRSSAVRDEAGSVVGVHGIARDITEERARSQQMRLLATALDHLGDNVTVTRLSGEIVYANQSFARAHGIEPGMQTRYRIQDFFPSGAYERIAGELQHALQTTGSWTGRVWPVRQDTGETVPLDLVMGLVDGAAEETLVFAVGHDARPEIEREKHLRRTERLASMGTLIGGVAHELNNPLHAIRNFAELMLFDPRSDDDLESLEIIKREADRAAKVVSDLRLIARATQEETSEREAVDLNDVVRHVLKVRRYALETGNVEVREDLAEDLPPVLANRGAVEQVVLNLVVNAEQAMSGQATERVLVLRTRSTPREVSLHVVDSGPGIPAADLERIFDPFFTTKAPGEGTGLGLSLVHSIVTEHGGEIHVGSEVGRGTTIRIDLPRAPVGQRLGRTRHGPAASSASALRILVVDDEESIRRMSVRLLERLGHRVEAAAEGAAALRMLEAADYDVILSDLRMPGLDGEELLERLRGLDRGLERRLVFVTGDAASGNAARMIAQSQIPVLVKPVRVDDLVRMVEGARARAS